MSQEIAEYFPHSAVYRAYDKEQRRRMMDYYGPERLKRKGAHHIASI